MSGTPAPPQGHLASCDIQFRSDVISDEDDEEEEDLEDDTSLLPRHHSQLEVPDEEESVTNATDVHVKREQNYSSSTSFTDLIHDLSLNFPSPSSPSRAGQSTLFRFVNLLLKLGNLILLMVFLTTVLRLCLLL